jgi:hypothetical protein
MRSYLHPATVSRLPTIVNHLSGNILINFQISASNIQERLTAVPNSPRASARQISRFMASAPPPPSPDFETVELALKSKLSSKLFIDSSRFSALALVTGECLVFFVVHLFTLIHMRASSGSGQEYHPLLDPFHDVPLSMEINITNLQSGYRFVSMSVAMVAQNASGDYDFPVEWAAEASFYVGSDLVNTIRIDNHTVPVHFRNGSTHSTFFEIGHYPVLNIDILQLKIVLEKAMPTMVGAVFEWGWAGNSNISDHRRVKLVLSILIGGALVWYGSQFELGAEPLTQFWAVLIGITGVFCSNPLAFVFGSESSINSFDYVAVSLFMVCLRMFFILQFDLIWRHRTAPSRTVIQLNAVFFTLYAVADAAVSYRSGFAVECVRFGFHVVYALYAIRYLIGAALEHDHMHLRRVVVFGASLFAHLGMTFMIDGLFWYWKKWESSHRGELFQLSLAMTMAAYLIIVVRHDASAEYNPLEEEPDKGAVIEIDQISDATPDNDDNSEEDDEEEEEK